MRTDRGRRHVARGAARGRDAAPRGLRRHGSSRSAPSRTCRTTGRRSRRSCSRATPNRTTSCCASRASTTSSSTGGSARRATRARRSRTRRSSSTTASSSTFDGLVIATGSSPRRLPTQPGPRRACSRSAPSTTRSRCAPSSTPVPQVVVIGAGFIGAEVAATCRERGLDVTVLEGAPAADGARPRPGARRR